MIPLVSGDIWRGAEAELVHSAHRAATAHRLPHSHPGKHTEKSLLLQFQQSEGEQAGKNKKGCNFLGVLFSALFETTSPIMQVYCKVSWNN